MNVEVNIASQIKVDGQEAIEEMIRLDEEAEDAAGEELTLTGKVVIRASGAIWHEVMTPNRYLVYMSTSDNYAKLRAYGEEIVVVTDVSEIEDMED